MTSCISGESVFFEKRGFLLAHGLVIAESYKERFILFAATIEAMEAKPLLIARTCVLAVTESFSLCYWSGREI